MAGYWPCFCVCVFYMDVNQVPQTHKKIGLYPAILTEQVWSKKECITWPIKSTHGKILAAESLARPFLPTQVANHNAGFMLLFAEPAM